MARWCEPHTAAAGTVTATARALLLSVRARAAMPVAPCVVAAGAVAAAVCMPLLSARAHAAVPVRCLRRSGKHPSAQPWARAARSSFLLLQSAWTHAPTLTACLGPKEVAPVASTLYSDDRDGLGHKADRAGGAFR